MPHLWCNYWVDRADAAVTYEDQVIVQSLFLRCIRKVWSISRAPASVVARTALMSLMLLDIEDGNFQQRPFQEHHLVKGAHRLANIPFYEWFIATRDELVRLVVDNSRREELSRGAVGLLPKATVNTPQETPGGGPRARYTPHQRPQPDTVVVFLTRPLGPSPRPARVTRWTRMSSRPSDLQNGSCGN